MNLIYSKKMNRGTFEVWNSKPEFELYQAKQVHGIDIVPTSQLPCEADGITSSWASSENGFAIKTADCMPILIQGRKGFVFLHAGWRGLADGILKSDEIQSIIPLNAFIGPCIQECCFEVSKDFQSNFLKSSQFKNNHHKYFFNLPAEAEIQLKDLYPMIEVLDSKTCTCCEQKFHSYRRDKTPQRNWNIFLKG